MSASLDLNKFSLIKIYIKEVSFIDCNAFALLLRVHVTDIFFNKECAITALSEKFQFHNMFTDGRNKID